MNKTLTVAQWEMHRGLRSKAFIISVFMPFIILLISVLPTLFALNGTPEEKDLGIIDQGNAVYGEISERISHTFKNAKGDPVYTLQEYVSTDENHDTLIQTLIKDNYAGIVIVIEADFLHRAGVRIYHDENVGLDEISRLEQVLKQYSMEKRIVSLGLTKQDMEYVLERPKVSVFEVGKTGDTTRSNLLIKYGIPGIFLWLLVMGIIMSSSMLISGVIEERSNRIMEIMLSSIKPHELMTGKILGIGMMGVIQICIYLVIILLLTIFGGSFIDLDLSPADVFTPNILWYFVYFIMGYFMYATLYVSLGSLFDNERDAQQSVGYLSLFAVLPIMLIQPIMMNPGTPLTTILSFIPLTTPFMMILKIGMLSAPLWEILLMMIYLLVWIFAIARAGSKIFRTTILMYGKRATLKEIIQWLRA
ncbi:MAG: ABC transporter permease [Candidatus Marinimicrobia bacterium]|nr:ABC transporter permease [Candidatus Neomarinimicrobiota bacterium]